MRIITISRQFGSGGREVSEKLAEKLGLAYYDKVNLSAMLEGDKDLAAKVGEGQDSSPRNLVVNPFLLMADFGTEPSHSTIRSAEVDLIKEKKYVQRLFAEVRKLDGGLSAYGENIVRDALNMGAVDMLLLSEGLDKRRISVQCPNGHVYDATVPDADEKIECQVCHASAQVVRNEDLVDDFFELADQYNTTVEIISMDSEEGQMLMNAFGGIAAILRYKVQ